MTPNFCAPSDGRRKARARVPGFPTSFGRTRRGRAPSRRASGARRTAPRGGAPAAPRLASRTSPSAGSTSHLGEDLQLPELLEPVGERRPPLLLDVLVRKAEGGVEDVPATPLRRGDDLRIGDALRDQARGGRGHRPPPPSPAVRRWASINGARTRPVGSAGSVIASSRTSRGCSRTSAAREDDAARPRWAFLSGVRVGPCYVTRHTPKVTATTKENDGTRRRDEESLTDHGTRSGSLRKWPGAKTPLYVNLLLIRSPMIDSPGTGKRSITKRVGNVPTVVRAGPAAGARTRRRRQIGELRWLWRSACSGTPLAPMIYTPSGASRAVPVMGTSTSGRRSV